ncbi:MAG: hypothetical protein VX727_05500 [Planctomycetota bacterium]|nr:hypothetical protein [Planctomycetota bacterium]|tara:strand:+ start:12323 stop:12547 length:225 start_codon:yes stop_codon:yes gene_type:complete
MNNESKPSNSIRESIRRLEAHVNQARSKRINENSRVPKVPGWVNSQADASDAAPRMKARRKEPGTFENWRRQAG